MYKQADINVYVHIGDSHTVGSRAPFTTHTLTKPHLSIPCHIHAYYLHFLLVIFISHIKEKHNILSPPFYWACIIHVVKLLAQNCD